MYTQLTLVYPVDNQDRADQWLLWPYSGSLCGGNSEIKVIMGNQGNNEIGVGNILKICYIFA